MHGHISNQYSTNRTQIDFYILESSQTAEAIENRNTVHVITPELEEISVKRPG